MKRLIVSWAVVVTSLVGSQALAASPETAAAQNSASCAEVRHVVIGVSDKEKVELALSNAQNLQQEFGAKCVDIEVVHFSAAVTMLTPMSPKGALLKEAMQNGIKLIACRNSMKKFKMTEEDLFPGIETVPSGVAEIVSKQGKGWAYLRP